MALSPGAPPRIAPPNLRDDREDAAHRARSSLAAQWLGVFLAPAVFFTHLQIGYVLVPWTCANGQHVWSHVAGALAVAGAAAGTWIAWRVWRREGDERGGIGSGSTHRASFLGLIGAAMSAMFALLLAAQWSAAFFISPCQ